MSRYFGKKNLLFCICFVTLLGASCNKKLDVDSTSLATEKTEWKSIDDTRSNLIGVYALFRAALANNNDFWLWGELRGGDFKSNTRSDLSAVISGDLNAAYETLNDMKDWRRFYAVVNAASLFIERSGEALVDPRYTTLNHEVDVAQARSLRAWAYFMMVRIWGDVPLITSSHDGDFVNMPRTSQDKVLSFCEDELNKAAQVLPFQYGVADDPIFPGNYYTYNQERYQNTLISRVAVYALLAHVAAWKGDYFSVDTYSKFAIDNMALANISYVNTDNLTSSSGIFYGRGDYNQMLGFNFVYGHGETGTSGEGHIESLTLASPLVKKQKPDIFIPKDSIGQIFNDPKDERFGFDTITGLPITSYFTDYNGELPIFSKIKVLGDGTSDGDFSVFSSAIIFSRIEELTLLRAEALTVEKKTNEAVDLLNIIRKNRGETLIKTNEDVDLLFEVFAERRRELLGEGWRWYDLVRYNRLRRSDVSFNKLLDEGGIYWPISQSVIDANPLITQNSYWDSSK